MVVPYDYLFRSMRIWQPEPVHTSHGWRVAKVGVNLRHQLALTHLLLLGLAQQITDILLAKRHA